MRRLLPLAVLVAVLAGCGGGGSKLESFDLGGGWKIVWQPDGTNARVEKDGKKLAADGIRIRALGPDTDKPAAAIPQVAAELTARADIANYTILLDGKPLDVKEGGSSRRLTVYGAPASSLSSGRHVVVAAVRAGESAAATAWVFTVR